MKSSIKNKVRGLAGILLIMTAIGMVYYWENYGREQILYQQVVFTREDIHRNDIISQKNVGLVKVEDFLINEATMKEMDLVLGKEAGHFIPKGTILNSSLIEDSRLVPDANQFIFEIPGDWIYNSPQTLRRGDEIILYPIQRALEKENNSENDGIHNPIEMEYTIENSETKERKMIIAYVKDGSNYEVEDEKIQGSARLYGTAVIQSIEVLATDQEIKELEALSKKGYQFIIVYRNRKVS